MLLPQQWSQPSRRGWMQLLRHALLLLPILCFSHTATAQAVPTSAAPDSVVSVDVQAPALRASLWHTLRRVLLPSQLGLMYDLREYITDLEPPEPRSRNRDLARLDAIYERAVYLSEGEPIQALLALTWATLPYHRFPAQIPLLGLRIVVPVSTESRDEFNRRLANLPGVLLSDTPPSLDRDKLPHFFGSAWMQCVLRSPEISDVLGEAVEMLEAVFKLEGSRDQRDVEVNRLGILFAMQLQRSRAVRPSQLFLMR